MKRFCQKLIITSLLISLFIFINSCTCDCDNVDGGGPITFIAYAEGHYDVYTIDPLTSEVRRLTDDDAFDFSPTWNPDRTRVAFGSERNGQRDIWTVDSDGANLSPVNFDDVLDQSPSWSPDGAFIAFEHLELGNQIWRMAPDGSGLVMLAGPPDHSNAQSPRWFSDSKEIAYDSGASLGNEKWQREIWIMNADGTDKRQITKYEGGLKFLEDVSPDGEFMLFSWRSGDDIYDLYTVRRDGSELFQLTDDPGYEEAAWSPDGSLIAVTGAGDSIRLLRPDGTKVCVLHTKTDGLAFGLDW